MFRPTQAPTPPELNFHLSQALYANSESPPTWLKTRFPEKCLPRLTVRDGHSNQGREVHYHCGCQVKTLLRIADDWARWYGTIASGLPATREFEAIFVNTTAFLGTNPTGELTTSALPVTRKIGDHPIHLECSTSTSAI